MGKPDPEKGAKMKRMVLIIYATILILSVYPVFAGEKKLTIVHSNDLHSHFLQFSGARITYNPNRMVFDRVTRIELGNEEDGYAPPDYAKSNTTLIRVAADIYNATFLKVVGDFTWHVLEIVPKDKDGNPITDLATARIDADKDIPGIQELKEYMSVLKYIQNFPDTTGNGLSDIPEKYSGPLGRNVIEASWNPFNLVKGGTYVT